MAVTTRVATHDQYILTLGHLLGEAAQHAQDQCRRYYTPNNAPLDFHAAPFLVREYLRYWYARYGLLCLDLVREVRFGCPLLPVGSPCQ
jgi:hypothetical protein